MNSSSTPTFSGQPATALAPAGDYALSWVREGILPITYTLSDPGSAPTMTVRAFYSPDGGGRWLPAVAPSAPVPAPRDSATPACRVIRTTPQRTRRSALMISCSASDSSNRQASATWERRLGAV